MEKKIFLWKEWDQVDTCVFQFYKCTIIKDFGPLKVGEFYPLIVVSFNENGGLQVYKDEDDEKFIYDIKCSLEVTK